MTLFWLFWTSMIGVADFAIARQGIYQLWSLTYVPVDAELLENEIRPQENVSDDGYQLAVRYRYNVAGQEYEAERTRYQPVTSGDKELLQREQPTAKPGEQITAYYDRSNPATAVLYRGMRIWDLFTPIFLLPFNAVSLVGLVMMFDSWRAHRTGRPWLCLSVREDAQGNQRITLYDASPLLVLIVAMGASGFALTFVVMMVPNTWLDPSVKVVIGWGVILAITFFWWRRTMQRFLCLTLDRFHEQVTYERFDLQEPDTIPLGQLAGIRRQLYSHTDSEGGNSTLSELQITTYEGKTWPLRTKQDEESSLLLAKWLAEQWKLPLQTEVLDDPDLADDEDVVEDEYEEDE